MAEVNCKCKILCEKCNTYITKNNFSKHLRRHENHPESFREVKHVENHDGLICIYCGKECKNTNSLKNHERTCKQNSNRFYLAGYRKNLPAWNKGLTEETDERVLKNSESRRKFYETHDGPFKGKKHSEESKNKCSYSMKKFLELNPDMVPYVRNHSSKASYPEMYFNELFNKENINLNYHKQIGSYQLDFYNEEKLIDIEIDGEQHYVDSKMPEHDKKRTEYLESLGWTVIRIRWSEYKQMTEDEKHNLILSLRDLGL